MSYWKVGSTEVRVRNGYYFCRKCKEPHPFEQNCNKETNMECITGKKCLGKKVAQTKKNFLSGNKSRGKDKLRVYRCPECDYWHLSKITRRKSIIYKKINKQNYVQQQEEETF